MKKSAAEFSSNLNRNQLKYLAVFAMLLDHIGHVFSGPLNASASGAIVYFILRFIGRLTAPTMCFFLAQGFIHTSSRKNYALRLLIFAILSQLPYCLLKKAPLLSLDFNMLFQLLICFLMLWVLEASYKWPLRLLLFLLLFFASFFCDWKIMAPLMVLTFYYLRNSKPAQTGLICILALFLAGAACIFRIKNGYIWYGELWQAGFLLFIPCLYCYNGQGGSHRGFNRWFFYIFYPAHLMILWLILQLYSKNM